MLFKENTQINVNDCKDEGLDRILAKCQFPKTGKQKPKDPSSTIDLIDQCIEKLVDNRIEELVRKRLENLKVVSERQAPRHYTTKHLKLEQQVVPKESCSCGQSRIEMSYERKKFQDRKAYWMRKGCSEKDAVEKAMPKP